MTNFEYAKDKILELNTQRKNIAVSNGEVMECAHTDCAKCDLFGKGGCSSALINWLYEEHIDTPKLTTFEHDFCKGAKEGYIARDLNGLLYYYTETPKKSKTSNDSWSGGLFVDIHKIKSLKFDFIKWEDENAWSIEELLQLAVK